MSEVPVVRDPPPEADRVRPVILVSVALASMLVGFLAVYLTGRGERIEEPPSEPGPLGLGDAATERSDPVLAVRPRPAEDATAAPASDEPSASTAPEPATGAPSEGPGDAGTAGSAAAPTGDQGAALRARAGDFYYWRCWDAGSDDPLPSENCERLRALEPQIRGQIDAIAGCARERGGGPGRLSLGMELDFAASNIRFWGGRSSTIANAADVAGCVRRRLRVDLESIRHLHSRYTVFLPVDLEPR